MEKNNKKRILYLIEILKKNSNFDRHLTLDEIITLLEEKNIKVDNRKTLYDDFKILNECGINVEYDNGYYLLDCPFNLSEIKIIQDSINSLKNLDTSFKNDINNKLYSFISSDEEKLLEDIKYTNTQKAQKLLPKMEDVLEAIKNHKMVSITTKNNQIQDVFPIFIHRANDYYYFYFHYQDNNKIYHYRFDNIKDVLIKDTVDNINIPTKKIINHINESSNSFYTKETTKVNITFKTDSNMGSNLIGRLSDDFPGIIINKDKATLFVSINQIFFSKILAYGNEIKISDETIAYQYVEYLKSIQNNYLN